MRSKASVRGHAIHPALIPFPIGFLVGGFGFDVAGRLTDSPGLWTTGGYLITAGIVAALVAAIPGFIDYFGSVPPRSSGKRRATLHMLANLSAVVAFAAAWLVRDAIGARPDDTTLLLEGAGTVLLLIGGWMGGILVERNQISVDHRYAGAGRWREARIEGVGSQEIVTVPVRGLEQDQMMLVHVDDRRIVVGRTADGWVAFDDRCPHRGGSLADGMLVCGTVQCPWHGSQFDVRSGAVRAGPAERGIRAYEVDERGGQLRIFLSERRAAARVPVG
jgi:nitrite reductase/ring-hydroxylating ferredoxin subunit/uncharacterized membrane protein